GERTRHVFRHGPRWACRSRCRVVLAASGGKQRQHGACGPAHANRHGWMIRRKKMTGALSVPGSNTDAQYDPLVTGTENCAVKAGATTLELVAAPHVVVPVESVDAGPRPMPSGVVVAGPVWVSVTLVRLS